MPLKKEGGKKKRRVGFSCDMCTQPQAVPVISLANNFLSLLFIDDRRHSSQVHCTSTSKELRLQRQAQSKQNEMQERKAHHSRSQGELKCKGKA